MEFNKNGLGTPERIVLILLIMGSLIMSFLLSDPVTDAKLIAVAQANPHSHHLVQSHKGSSDSLFKNKAYVGPPSYRQRATQTKFRELQILDLNQVDSLTLLKVPGIGPAFAHRILSLRKLLGGYSTVYQLQEVYGMDGERFTDLKPWFRIKTQPKTYPLVSLSPDSLPRHYYMSYAQHQALRKYLKRNGRVCRWAELMTLEVFSQEDSIRLSPYYPEGIIITKKDN